MRGQVKIRNLLNDTEELFSFGALTDKAGARTFHISREGRQGDVMIASVQGITDRNQAEALKGIELYALAERLPEPPPGNWYHADLIGLSARLETGGSYGKVIAIHNFGAGDIVELQLPGGKTEMLPFNEPYVGRVSPELGQIVVRPPDYVEPEEKS